LYAGIGYFTLPYLVHAGAAHVHACEWDEDALAALSRNVAANGVERRCTVHAGDNVQAAATLAGVAHRVNLGLIPSSEAGWPVAVAVLLPEGGTLHVHACVGAGASEEDAWGRALLARLEALAAGMGRRGWAARLLHLERVKSYAPRLNHVVADVRLAPVRVA
jgi:tRNA G37 N-methylase Trm5